MLSKCVLGFCLIFAENILCQRDEDFLPKNVKPIRYTLTFELMNYTHYRGSALIEIEVIDNTNDVTLHAKNLYVNENAIKVFNENGSSIPWSNSTIDKSKDFYTIKTDEVLHKNEKYNVAIDEFIGTTTKEKSGIFKAEYQTLNNTTSHLVVTEFSPMNARTAFPCFDETALKAVFIVNLIRPSEKISASNMPLLKTIDLGNNRYQDVYQETPPISSYLVAFIIASYKYTNNNRKIRILAPEQCVDDGSMNYVLKESSGILKAFEEFTGIEYALPKLDLVSLPNKYYVDGAMENWGLITYNDKYLSCPATSSTNQFQLCFTFTAHELTHQWFGNLVTPKKWNYLWLSEGFATYFQYHIGEHIKPSWRLKEQFVIEVLHSVMFEDFMKEPINFAFSRKNDFPNPYIYYQKASSIIRMTSHILTEEIFRDGLRHYLKNNKYKATEPLDLFDAFQKALDLANKKHLLGNLTIHQILETWITNTGFPILNAVRNYQTETVNLIQKSHRDFEDNGNTVWHIPITYVFSNNNKSFDFNNTTTDYWLSDKNGTIYINSTDGWYLINKLGTGYYRVNYDETNWNRIIDLLQSEEFEVIPPLNRAQLINDAFYFVNHKALNPKVLFNLTMYLTQETDYIPVVSFIRNIALLHIGDSLKKFDNKQLYEKYLRKLLNASYLKLGIDAKDTDTHIDRLHRKMVLPLICGIDDECQHFGLNRLRNWQTTGVPFLTGDFDKSLLCGAIKQCTVQDWEFLLEQYFSCQTQDLKRVYLNCLSCSNNEVIIHRFLDEIFNLNNTMTPKDRSYSVSYVASISENGKKLVLEHLLKIKDDTIYKNAFTKESPIYLKVSSFEATNYVSLIRQKIRIIPITFVRGKKIESDITEDFFNWCIKYLSDT